MWGLSGATLGEVLPGTTRAKLYTPTGNCQAGVTTNCKQIVQIDTLTMTATAVTNVPTANGDSDMGSSATYFNGLTETPKQLSGCPNPLIAGTRKDGLLYIANAATMVSTQTLKINNGPALINQPAWDPATATLIVANGNAVVGLNTIGLIAYSLNSLCQLTVKWTVTLPSVGGSPTISGAPGNRIAWICGGTNLYGVNLQTGLLVQTISSGGTCRSSASVANGIIMLPTSNALKVFG